VRSRLTVRMRRRDVLDSVVTPETIDAPERRYPALGAYACPCEDEDSVNRSDSEHGSSVPSSDSDCSVAWIAVRHRMDGSALPREHFVADQAEAQVFIDNAED
jgi:hypothetical protein